MEGTAVPGLLGGGPLSAARRKQALLDAVIARLSRDVDALVASQLATQRGATHSESKQENAKDTRAIESGYLARGLAARVEALREALSRLRGVPATLFDDLTPIRLGAAACLLDEHDRARFVVLLPASGGLEVSFEGQRYRVVTPASPLGRALQGCRVGDEMTIQSPRGLVEYELKSVF